MGTRDVVVVVQKDDHSPGYFDFATGAELRLLVCNRESAVFDVARQAISGRIRTPRGPVRIARRGPPPQVVA